MNENHLSRREFLISTSALAAGGVLAACSPGAPPAATTAPEGGEPAATAVPPTAAPAKPGGSLLRFWTGWGGGTFSKAMEEITASEEWKEALGDNTFELKDAVSGEVMLAAVASGDPPECGSNIQYLDFMARGALIPIDDMVAASSIVNKDDFVEGNWNLAFYKGTMYGVPGIEGFVRFALNYNTKLVEEAELDPDSPPETWDEVYAWHEKLTKFDDAGNVLGIGLNPYGAMGEGFWSSDGWMVTTSWGWKWFDENNGTFDLNNEKMIDAFATQKRFIDLVAVDNLASVYSVEGRDTWGGAYNAEVEAMIIEGYWHPGETMNDKPEVGQYNRATWLPVPESRRGVKAQCSGGHLVVFFSGATNPQAAFAIAEFMNHRVACDAFFNNLGWLPAIKSYYDEVDASVYPGLDFYFRSATEATEWHTPAQCEITEFASNEYLSLKDEVNRDEMTPAEAAAELQKRCQDEYSAAGFGS